MRIELKVYKCPECKKLFGVAMDKMIPITMCPFCGHTGLDDAPVKILSCKEQEAIFFFKKRVKNEAWFCSYNNHET